MHTPPTKFHAERQALIDAIKTVSSIASRWLSSYRIGVPRRGTMDFDWPPDWRQLRAACDSVRQLVAAGADRWISPVLQTAPGAWTTGLLKLLTEVEERMPATDPRMEGMVDTADIELLDQAVTQLDVRVSELRDLDLAGLMLATAGTSDKTDEPRPRITRDEANALAIEYLHRHHTATLRELAKEIGCSTGLVAKLPIWMKLQEFRKEHHTAAPKTASLTPDLERALGAEDAELRHLVGERAGDSRPKIHRHPSLRRCAHERSRAIREREN